ncbi:MAG: hypothetical protein ACI4XL_06070 [Bacillus sp. (in: firmicutes)]
MDKRFDNVESELKDVKNKVTNLSKVVQSSHQDIKADEILLSEVRSLKNDIVFVNRKVADNKLTINRLKGN